MPPHPNATIKFEGVHDMRRRLNRGFNYTTRFVDAEMCRYLTEEECKENDERMKEHAEAHKALTKTTRSNPSLGKINVSPLLDWLTPADPYIPLVVNLMKNIACVCLLCPLLLQALVLMIRFSDHTERPLIGKADVDEFWQDKVPAWLEVNSQGLYNIDATVIDWVTTDNTEAYYSFGIRGTTKEAQKMAWPSLDILDNQPGWDWSKFDMDGNGELDSVVIVHSGYGAETVTTDCFGADFNDRIWAHAFSSTRRDSWTSKDGSVRINGYTMASALDGDCETVLGKIGLTCHEYMHTLGLEDLYDGVDPLAAYGVGAFDIMADPYGQNGDPDFPGHLSAWSKELADWVNPTVITANGDYTIRPSETSDDVYRITLADFGIVSEYLLIENRQPLEFDINIWSEGLVIYHIDDAADLQMNKGYPGQPGWPENGNHYFVALLPKDGNYDLEQGVNNGDAGDMWLPGDILGPGNGGTVYPNTDLYQGGLIQESGYWIQVLEQKENRDITFRVGGFDGDLPPSGEEEATAAPTAPPTVATESPATQVPTLVPTITTESPTTQAPTTAPTLSTENPTTQVQTQTPTITAATDAPTITPTTQTPTLPGTTAPTTQAPTEVPTITSTTSSPSLRPTVRGTEAPTSAGGFGAGEDFIVTKSPTRMPSFSVGYLSSYRPYANKPTPSPNEAEVGSGFLGGFGGSEGFQGQDPSGRDSSYLSGFDSAEVAREGPPRKDIGFLGDSFADPLVDTGEDNLEDDAGEESWSPLAEMEAPRAKMFSSEEERPAPTASDVSARLNPVGSLLFGCVGLLVASMCI